jgi:transcriptional regulator with XRE-family HTH domain
MKHADVGSTVRGRPACDEVYERFLREHFKQSALDNDAFVRSMAKRFRQAPLAVCAKAIGVWVNRHLRKAGWSQQDLAERIGVDRSAVAYWIRGGTITLDNLARVLIEFECQWSELPMPTRQELALAAYRVALGFVRERLCPDQEPELPDAEQFWGLFHLFSEPYWELGIRRQDPDLLRREAARVEEAVRLALARAPRLVVGVEGLRRLVREWGLAWLVCIGKVPSRWAVL